MKKTIYIIFALMFTAAISKAQTGCHAMFGSHQTANTLTVNFTNSSTSPHTISSWLWNFGDGSTSTSHNPSHTYAHGGNYNVCLTIHDVHGCSSTLCHNITINAVAPACHAAFTFHTNSTGTNFTNTSTGTTVHTTYLWQFGDGTTSTAANPHHIYAHAGHYNVCLYISDPTTGCSSHRCRSVNYHHSFGHHHHNHHHSALAPAAARTESDFDQVYIVNYPNPFVSSTTVQYELAEDASVKIDLYDMLGNRISQIISENKSEGLHTQLIKADNLNSGFYLLKMIVGEQSFTKKIAVAK